MGENTNTDRYLRRVLILWHQILDAEGLVGDVRADLLTTTDNMILNQTGRHHFTFREELVILFRL